MTTPKDDLNTVRARGALLVLDEEARKSRLRHEDPILPEVIKALTLAQLYPGIEARVICQTIAQMVDVVWILQGKVSEMKGTWSIVRRTLELPNGSAVVVSLGPKP